MEPIIGGGASAPDMAGEAPADLVKESSQQAFAQDVIEASMSVPVIVDFWAPWCGPCKQLGPMLETAVKAARGAVRMVKINIDENQQLAGQLRIQSIPTVYAFFQGQPVDGFQGAQPESEVKAFVERLRQAGEAGNGPSPVQQAVEQAQAALEAGDTAAAAALFSQVLQHEPENPEALAGLLGCYLANGDLETAQEMFDGLTDELKKNPAFASIGAQLDLQAQAGDAGEIPKLMEQVAANHNDHQARFDLAMALHGNGQQQAAADALLEIMRRDRTWNDDGARKQLLTFFEAWGPTDPLTIETRRQLSSLLFS
ncbi:thioredoxin [Pelagibius litoralis]|uniref:Thioredoxin n=1 Tax=Pelagibius litoralis TaxID=374515 RepID=A0A967F0V5_9PROT|nr:thioredoxin [Pelagibius litoralis]NIA71015.1 thioredoxin [Pelagibius litoralis]